MKETAPTPPLGYQFNSTHYKLGCVEHKRARDKIKIIGK